MAGYLEQSKVLHPQYQTQTKINSLNIIRPQISAIFPQPNNLYLQVQA